MSPAMQELPHALMAWVPVRNWRRESALAERAPRNIMAIKTCLIIIVLLLDKFSLLLREAEAGHPAGNCLRCQRGYNKSTAVHS